MKISDQRVAMAPNPDFARYDESSFVDGASQIDQEVELLIKKSSWQ